MHHHFDFNTQRWWAEPHAGGPSWDERADDLADDLSAAGRELTRHLQNISEAMDDYDSDLTLKWAALLREQGWTLANEIAAAYLSLAIVHRWQPGLEVFDQRFPAADPPPAPLDAKRWPVVPRKGVRKGIRAINARTQSCLDEVDELQYWLDEYLELVLGWCGHSDPVQTANAVVENIGGVIARTEDIVELWQEYVVVPHRKLAATQRGRRPPRFLEVEKMIDAMIAKFRTDSPGSSAA